MGSGNHCNSTLGLALGISEICEYCEEEIIHSAVIQHAFNVPLSQLNASHGVWVIITRSIMTPENGKIKTLSFSHIRPGDMIKDYEAKDHIASGL